MAPGLALPPTLAEAADRRKTPRKRVRRFSAIAGRTLHVAAIALTNGLLPTAQRVEEVVEAGQVGFLGLSVAAGC